MNPAHAYLNQLTRRQFFSGAGLAMGGVALNLLAPRLRAASASSLSLSPSLSPVAPRLFPPLGGFPHFAPTAKRIIYLHMNGGPSQLDTLDYKPALQPRFQEDLPESIRQGQRITTMTSGQTKFPVAPTLFKFAQHGQSGAWISELLPWTAKVVDDIAIDRDCLQTRTQAWLTRIVCQSAAQGDEGHSRLAELLLLQIGDACEVEAQLAFVTTSLKLGDLSLQDIDGLLPVARLFVARLQKRSTVETTSLASGHAFFEIRTSL